MANASFTRDEVILALDVLYFSEVPHPTVQTKVMQELSALLNRLPIHPLESRDERFRNPTGVARQINLFRASKKSRKRDPNVGTRFYEIDAEFDGRKGELHSIATAIRRNERLYRAIGFGNVAEAPEFPEGALLGHLHRIIETRDSAVLTPEKRCDICQIDTTDIYPGCPNLMRMHLTVPVTELDGARRYRAADFIAVCPNCHAALHQRRPWLTKERCGELLR